MLKLPLPVAEWKTAESPGSNIDWVFVLLHSDSFCFKKMNPETTTLVSLTKAMKRVDHKLQALEAQFKELDITKDNLTEKFENHSKTLASQAAQDELWTAVLALKFTSMELNLLYSYVIEVLICLHTRVLEKLPDLERSLPTFTSVLRRKVKNQRIRAAWESVLEESGLQEGDAAVLCAFFLAHGSHADHYAATARRTYVGDVAFVITSAVEHWALRDGLLRAVQVVDKGKAARTPEEQTSSLKHLLPSVKNQSV